jgi:hypothetical protein
MAVRTQDAGDIRMNSLNWPRIFLCGFVTGVVFALLSAVLIGLVGEDFLAAVGAPDRPRRGPGLYFAAAAAGIWAMWLYAAIRPRFPGNLGAVIAVGFAWWILAGLQSLKWILLLGIPSSAWLPLSLNLGPILIAIYAGSLLYGIGSPPRSSASPN